MFVVGGGNYIEYQNLRDYVKAKNTGNIIPIELLFYYKFVRFHFCANFFFNKEYEIHWRIEAELNPQNDYKSTESRIYIS